MNRDRRILTLLAALGASVTHLVPGEPAESRLLVPTRIASETAGTPSRRVQRLKSDESIFIFPGFVCLAAGSTNWETTIHIWVGELEPRSAALGTLRGALGLATDVSAEESVIFRERTRWFLADNERGKVVSLRAGTQRIEVGPTAANGHAFADIRLESVIAGSVGEAMVDRTVKITLDETDPSPSVPTELFILAERGISVISDIDDTIKITEVLDRPAMLRNTFLRPFRPVPGMAALYEGWRANEGAQFHYVSASPWQLYPALAEFRRTNGFPAGTFHLKTFRWKDESFFDLVQSPLEYKLGVLEPLLAKFPQRRFRLVGDSGEADPEVYGELARRHPEQIERILIRELSGADRSEGRYRAAFRDVPPEIWSLFHQP
jgi:hypothetical protein